MERKTRPETGALAMVNASMASARAWMDGVVPTAMHAVPETASAAVATGSALRVIVTATLVGLVMDAMSALVCMTAPNTDTATTEPACARRATVVVIARCRLSPNRASVLFTACEAAFSSAPRSTKHKELARHTSAIPSAHRSASRSVWLARCL